MATYDAIVIGAGQAGPALAGRLSDAGKTVALVERKLIGGTCVNTGCTPTKALFASAYAAHLARRAGEYGIDIGGKIQVDFAAVMARKDAIVAKSRADVTGWIGSMENCTLMEGHARFVGPHTIEVGRQLLSAPQVFINTGGRAAVPDMPGIGDITFCTNTTVLELKTLPRHLVIVGGSYVGLEFAQVFRRLGSEVTVVEMGERLVKREDADISAAIAAVLEGEGIRLRLKAECIAFAAAGSDIAVRVNCSEGAPEVVGSHVLLAVGRRPNTDDLGLDAAGIAADARGTIIVDDELRTNVPGVWALGECNGRGAFTHTAYNDYEIVAANLLGHEARKVSARIPAYALYVDPPLGRVGMTEAEARAAGRRFRVGMRPMTGVARATEKGETAGLMKAIVDADTGKILGAAIFGVGGDEAVHGVVDMMNAGAGADVLQRAVPIHPTVSELIPTILGELGPLQGPS